MLHCDSDPAQELLEDPEDQANYQGESGQTITVSERTEFMTNKRNAANWISARQKYGTPTKSGK